MTEVTRADLDRFFSDPAIHRLVDLTRETRPLQICYPREVPVSKFMAWIFDPSEGHGLSDQVLRRLLIEASQRQDGIELTSRERNALSPTRLAARSFTQCLVQAEVNLGKGNGSLDVLVLDPRQRFLVAIENKFGAAEGRTQLNRYRDALASLFPAFVRIHIFLDQSDAAPTAPAWIGLNYDWLVRELQAGEKSPWLGTVCKQTLREFRNAIQLDADAYEHVAVDEDTILNTVQEHRSIIEQMARWLRPRRGLAALVKELHGERQGEDADGAGGARDLLPVFWNRYDLWRLCVPMLAIAPVLVRVKERFPDVVRVSKRKAFFFSLPTWNAFGRNNVDHPIEVMLRVLPLDGEGRDQFVVVAILRFEFVAESDRSRIETVARELRSNNLSKRRRFREDVRRATLRVDRSDTEEGAIRQLIDQIALVDREIDKSRIQT